jgi:hypothetical protein
MGNFPQRLALSPKILIIDTLLVNATLGLIWKNPSGLVTSDQTSYGGNYSGGRYVHQARKAKTTDKNRR